MTKKSISKSIPLGERLIAGFLFALAVGITAICVPIVLLFVTRGKGAIFFVQPYRGFGAWEGGLLLVASVAGMIMGLDRSAEMLGHLWGTEKPANMALTVALWAGFMLAAVCSYWLYSGHR